VKIDAFSRDPGNFYDHDSVFEDSAWKLPQDWLSVSQFNQFLKCPRAYQQNYIQKRKQPSSSNQVIGSAVHRAIGWALMHKIGDDIAIPDLGAVDEAEGYFREVAWNGELESAGGLGEISWDDTLKPDELADLGARMTRLYVEKVVPRLNPDQVEMEFLLEVPGVPIPVKGFIDVVQKANKPCIDIKTSKKRDTFVLPSWRLQGRVYQLALGGRSVDWHVLTKQVTPQVATSLECPDLLQVSGPDVLKRTAEAIKSLAWQINAMYCEHGPDDDWPWTAGMSHTFACMHCAYKRDCPAWEGLL
jgi:hypothetical protein